MMMMMMITMKTTRIDDDDDDDDDDNNENYKMMMLIMMTKMTIRFSASRMSWCHLDTQTLRNPTSGHIPVITCDDF